MLCIHCWSVYWDFVQRHFCEKKRTKFQYSVPCESVKDGIVISFEILTTRCPIQWEILVHSMNPIFASLGIVNVSFWSLQRWPFLAVKIRRDVGETNSELVVLKQLCVQSVDALKTNSELVVLKQLCVQSVDALKTNSELVVLKQLCVQSVEVS